MKKQFLYFVLAVSTLSAGCSPGGDADAPAPTSAQPGSPNGSTSVSTERPRKQLVFPSGFNLPFQYTTRSKRAEKIGGATKWRVIVEVRGVSLDEADLMLSKEVAKSGYTRGQRRERENGFIVSYEGPQGLNVQTSFFDGSDVVLKDIDGTGVLHVTWIVRK